MALEQVVQKNNTLYLKGHHVPHSFDVVLELEICMLINEENERSTIFIICFVN